MKPWKRTDDIAIAVRKCWAAAGVRPEAWCTAREIATALNASAQTAAKRISAWLDAGAISCVGTIDVPSGPGRPARLYAASRTVFGTVDK